MARTLSAAAAGAGWLGPRADSGALPCRGASLDDRFPGGRFWSPHAGAGPIPAGARCRSSIGTPRLSETFRNLQEAGLGRKRRRGKQSAGARPVPASAGAGMLHIRLRPVLNRTAESRGNGISTSTGAPLPCAQTPSAHMGARQLILTAFAYPQNSNERSHWLRKVPALPCAARPRTHPNSLDRSRQRGRRNQP